MTALTKKYKDKLAAATKKQQKEYAK